MRPSSTCRSFIASGSSGLLAGFLRQRGDLVRALRALGNPGVQLLDIQHQTLVVRARGTRIEVTQALDVATVAGAALVGHHDVVKRPTLGACARKTNPDHDLSTPNETAAGRSDDVGARETPNCKAKMGEMRGVCASRADAGFSGGSPTWSVWARRWALPMKPTQP